MRKILLISIILISQNVVHSQWTLLQTGITNGLYSCSFINSQIGWVAGTEIYKTTNAGINWVLLYNVPSSDRLDCMIFKNAFTGWAGSYQGKVYKTTNGGNNWNISTIASNYRMFDIFFIDLLTGWVVGETGKYRKTTDGGNSWQGVTGQISTTDICNIWFINNNTGFACGYQYMAKSTDGGNNWYFSAMTGYSPQTIYFINSYTGWIAGSKLYPSISASGLFVMKTQNGGLSWDSISVGSTYNYHHVGITNAVFLTNQIGYLCGYDVNATQYSTDYYGTIRKTTNSGINWESITINYSIDFINDMSFGDMQTGYAVGSSPSTIYKTTNAVGISFISGNIPMNFSLSQNYPNPFNPSTTIEFDIAKKESVLLSLYDITGRLIETLHNGLLQPGRYRVLWNGENYSSGVYFYTLKTESFSQTKRMVLVK